MLLQGLRRGILIMKTPHSLSFEGWNVAASPMNSRKSVFAPPTLPRKEYFPSLAGGFCYVVVFESFSAGALALVRSLFNVPFGRTCILFRFSDSSEPTVGTGFGVLEVRARSGEMCWAQVQAPKPENLNQGWMSFNVSGLWGSVRV